MDESVGITALERVPFFAGLEHEDLQRILSMGKLVSFDAGSTIVERGGPGDAMYVVVGGRAQVDVGGRFHDLSAGDFFGEMAVVAGRPRMATVTAVEPVEALRIDAADVQAFVLEHPKVALAMLRSLVERLREVQERLDSWMGAW